MSKSNGAIVLITKITSTIDAGYAVTLSFTEADLPLVQELMNIKKDSSQVAVVFQRVDEPKPYNPISAL